jgi:hypothetical protein
VVVPQNLQEEVAETVKSHEEEEQPSEPSPSPEPAPEDKFEPCHTHPEEGDQKGSSPNPPKTVPAVQWEKSATPPLYMKVSQWAETSTVLEYHGDYDYFGLVLLKGEKRAKIESIKKNQKVIIDSLNHSSFLFNPEDSENLMVYVIPIEDQTTWTEGVAVKAMYLVESSSFT